MAIAAPPVDPAPAAKAEDTPPVDDLPNPLEEKRRALREQAVADVVSGEAKAETRNGSTVVKVGQTPGRRTIGGKSAKAGKDQYVELGREKTDRIFVILAEFGNERHPRYPDQDTDPGTAGPTTLRRPAAQPDPRARTARWTTRPSGSRTTPPTTTATCTSATGTDVESVKTYFETQSSGRYSVDGEVTDWVKVKYNEARYGRSGDDPTTPTATTRRLRQQRLQQHLGAGPRRRQPVGRRPAGRRAAPTPTIAADLKSFDQWDRYDFDGDGNFNEPDGYIDHFQIVHAGGDEADGDP